MAVSATTEKNLFHFPAQDAKDAAIIRAASFVAVALTVNVLVCIIMQSSFFILSASIGITVVSVVVEEHLFVNLYLAIKNSGAAPEDRWCLTNNEIALIGTIACLFYAFLVSNYIFPFASPFNSLPLFYRSIPSHWISSLGFATINVTIDLLSSYKKIIPKR